MCKLKSKSKTIHQKWKGKEIMLFHQKNNHYRVAQSKNVSPFVSA